MIIKALIFNVTSSKLPRHYKKASEDINNYPPINTITAYLIEVDTENISDQFKSIVSINSIIKNSTSTIGVNIADAVIAFQGLLIQADVVVAYNLQYHREAMFSEFLRIGLQAKSVFGVKSFCLMKYCSNRLKIPGRFEGQYKFPVIEESLERLTEYNLEDFTDSYGDQVGYTFGTIKLLVDVMKSDKKVVEWFNGSRDTMH